MKNIVLLSLPLILITGAVPTWANEIKLKPGSDLTIKASSDTHIVCEGESAKGRLPTCTVEQLGNGYYGVMMDSKLFSSKFSIIEVAVMQVQELQDKGICAK